MSAVLRPALVLLGLFTALCGGVYPAAITGLAQAAFPRQANGSLIERNGTVVGSSLIGQSFTDPAYFWGRASATAPFANNAGASAGTNLGPTNPALLDAVSARVETLRAADPDNHDAIPVDLVTASGSGLDPHVSPAAAHYQVRRVARARGLSVETVEGLVRAHTKGRLLGLLGEPHVNVLELNLALDEVRPRPPEPSIASHAVGSDAP